MLTPPLLHLEPCLNAIDRPAPEMVPHGFPVGNTFSAGCQQSVTIMVKQPPVGLTAFIDRQRCDHEIADIAQTVADPAQLPVRSEEHTSELQSLMRTSYAVFCLKKKN